MTLDLIKNAKTGKIFYQYLPSLAVNLLAADYLTQAAIELLMHGNLSYSREKFQSGLRWLASALYEG